MSKVYLVFAGVQYYPNVANDLRGAVSTAEEATALLGDFFRSSGMEHSIYYVTVHLLDVEQKTTRVLFAEGDLMIATTEDDPAHENVFTYLSEQAERLTREEV